MMPSHSMDLPVPRGTSMLMLGGSHHIVQKLKCRCVPCFSDIVSMFKWQAFVSALTVSPLAYKVRPLAKYPQCCMLFAALKGKLNPVIFVFRWSFGGWNTKI